MVSKLLLLLLIITASMFEAVPSPSGTMRYVSSNVHTPSSSRRIDTREAFDQKPPPPFSSPAPMFPDGTDCESDCLQERLDDCSLCFNDESRTKICEHYVMLLANSNEEPAQREVNKFKMTVAQTTSPRCAGMVLYLSNYDKLEQKEEEGLNLLQLIPDDELIVEAFAHFFILALSQETDSPVKLRGAEIENADAARTSVYVPYRIRISVKTHQEMRKLIISRALRKLAKKTGFETLGEDDVNIQKITQVGKDGDNIIFSVTLNFKDIFF